MPRKTAAAKQAAAEAARVAAEMADKMAKELRKRAMEVDRWISSLEELTDPTTGPAKHSHISLRYESLVHFLKLVESWDTYQDLYYNTPDKGRGIVAAAEAARTAAVRD